MESERNKLIQLLFPNGIPADWMYSANFNQYLSKLEAYKLEDLLKEPIRLKDEKSSIADQRQELAVSNYKTFIQTSECSRDLFQQFEGIETKVDILLENIPHFETEVQKFADETNEINNLRRLNSLTLTRNAQLLEILELPQLMDSFIKDGLYEEALELVAYVRRLHHKHSDIPIFQSIVDDVEKSWLTMLHQLLAQLRQELSLSKCLQIVGHLRRMEVFTEAELRLKFLQTRDTWLQNTLNSIPNEDANFHLNKVIEVTRVNLFNIVTQYRAIFNDDEHSPLSSNANQYVNQYAIFYTWIRDKVSDFLETLETDLNRGVTSLDSILGQCMYFGLSFSRVGCDFRSLMVPIFVTQISKNFQNAVSKATRNVENNLERYTLINKNLPNVPWKLRSEDENQPPDSLLEFYPLADYLNGILTALNELRLCPPIAVVTDVVNSLNESLESVSKAIFMFYGQEQQAFTPASKDAFTRLCICYADDLVPFVQKCIHVIFPPNVVAAHVGVNVQTLQKEGILYLDRVKVTEPIQRLLPEKIEPVLDGVVVGDSL